MKLTKEDIQKYGTEEEKILLENINNFLKEKINHLMNIASLMRNANTVEKEMHIYKLMKTAAEEIYKMGKRHANQDRTENKELGLP